MLILAFERRHICLMLSIASLRGAEFSFDAVVQAARYARNLPTLSAVDSGNPSGATRTQPGGSDKTLKICCET